MPTSFKKQYEELKKEVRKFPIIIKEPKYLESAGRFASPIGRNNKSTICILKNQKYADKICSLLHEFSHFLCYYDRCNCMNKYNWISEYHAFKYELLIVANYYPYLLRPLLVQYCNILKVGESYPLHNTALEYLMKTSFFKKIVRNFKRRKKI